MKVKILGSNSLEIEFKDKRYLQSYKSIVASFDRTNFTYTVYPMWDYSRTTAKHVSQWTGYSSKEIRRLIKDGVKFKYEDKEPEL